MEAISPIALDEVHSVEKDIMACVGDAELGSARSGRQRRAARRPSCEGNRDGPTLPTAPKPVRTPLDREVEHVKEHCDGPSGITFRKSERNTHETPESPIIVSLSGRQES